MLNKRKLEIVAAVAVLIMVVILLWLLFKRDKPEPGPSLPTAEDPVVVTPPSVNPDNIPAPGIVTAATVARTFIERFGSYSSESDFANVDDIKDLATPSFQAELDQQVAALRADTDPGDGYTGVSTRIISIVTVAESETSATFKITTQREDSVGTPGNTTVRYQDVEMSLIKSGEDWLVDDVTWE